MCVPQAMAALAALAGAQTQRPAELALGRSKVSVALPRTDGQPEDQADGRTETMDPDDE